MGMFRRLKFFQKLLAVSIFLNILSVVSLFVWTGNLVTLSTNTNLEAEFKRKLYRDIGVSKSLLRNWIRKSDDLSEIEKLRQSFEIKASLEKSLPEDQQLIEPLDKNLLSREKSFDLLDTLDLKQANLYISLGEISKRVNAIKLEIIILGVMSVLFGLIIPAAVMRAIKKQVIEIRRSYQKLTADWIENFNEEKASHDRPFRSPKFWTRMGLKTVEKASQTTNNPMYQLAGEIAGEILIELRRVEKSSVEKTNTGKSNDENATDKNTDVVGANS